MVFELGAGCMVGWVLREVIGFSEKVLKEGHRSNKTGI